MYGNTHYEELEAFTREILTCIKMCISLLGYRENGMSSIVTEQSTLNPNLTGRIDVCQCLRVVKSMNGILTDC
jgi:hypothetical protein